MRWAGGIQRAVGAAVGLALFVWLAPLLASSSPVYWHEDIDINGGRYRYQRFVIGVLIEERVEETALSGLYRKHVAVPGKPVWRRVNTFTPGRPRVSPHHAHHSALHASRRLVESLDWVRFTDSATAEVVVTFLGLLRLWDRDDEASDYVDAVQALALRASETGSPRVVTKALLPAR